MQKWSISIGNKYCWECERAIARGQKKLQLKKNGTVDKKMSKENDSLKAYGGQRSVSPFLFSPRSENGGWGGLGAPEKMSYSGTLQAAMRAARQYAKDIGRPVMVTWTVKHTEIVVPEDAAK